MTQRTENARQALGQILPDARVPLGCAGDRKYRSTDRLDALGPNRGHEWFHARANGDDAFLGRS